MSTKGIDKAIENVRQRNLHDSYWNGSLATENKAYTSVRQRLADARPFIDKEFLSVFDALTNGVLADIQDAGTEIRKRVL